MKVSLIVASGVHQGKAIPVAGAQFLIGRDPSCQLRPASQAISKQHCGFLVRDGKVFAIDYGSTNGTSINDEALAANVEREVNDGDRVKAGPLDFTISIAKTKPSDATPLPAAMKPVSGPAVQKLKEAATGSKPAQPKVPAKAPANADSEDDIAAMMLGMGEDDAPSSGTPYVPEGSTIMEMPAAMLDPNAPKKDEPAAAKPTVQGSSNAAEELLRKYMRRPR